MRLRLGQPGRTPSGRLPVLCRIDRIRGITCHGQEDHGRRATAGTPPRAVAGHESTWPSSPSVLELRETPPGKRPPFGRRPDSGCKVAGPGDQLQGQDSELASAQVRRPWPRPFSRIGTDIEPARRTSWPCSIASARLFRMAHLDRQIARVAVGEVDGHTVCQPRFDVVQLKARRRNSSGEPPSRPTRCGASVAGRFTCLDRSCRWPP